jgi:ComF family protein
MPVNPQGLLMVNQLRTLPGRVGQLYQQLVARLPDHCLLCAAPTRGLALCHPCHADLPWNLHACQRCALPSPTPVCGKCRDIGPGYLPPQDFSLAPLRYEFPVDQLIAGLKYHDKLAHAPLLGTLLKVAVLEADRPRPDVLLPVPLHESRLGERGYNQALEIARPLARHFGLPLETRLVARVRATAAQMSLDAAARQRNPAQAFWLDTARLGNLDSPQRVAVIDDVMTTGATLTAIGKLLKRAGIPHVEFWGVARTP